MTKRHSWQRLFVCLALGLPAACAAAGSPAATEPAAAQQTPLPSGPEGFAVEPTRTPFPPTPTEAPPTAAPTATATRSNTPTPTRTPGVRDFDPADTLLTLVLDGWIYAVDLDGDRMPLWNKAADERISGEGFLMKISPDRSRLAFSGTGTDGKPSLEVLDLASRKITARFSFSGSRVADFAWSPSSASLAAAVIDRKNRKTFGSVVYRVDLSDAPASAVLFRSGNTALSQVEWLLPDRIAYVDFSCENAAEEIIWYDELQLCGHTGVGVVETSSGKSVHRELASTVNWPGGRITVSPDQQRLLFFSHANCGSNPPQNTLLTADTLEPVPCPFCGSYNQMDWFGDFILAQVPAYCGDYGNIYLLEAATGYARSVNQFGTFQDALRVMDWKGATMQIAYLPFEGGWVSVSDISACTGKGWEFVTCYQYWFGYKAESPDSFNSRLWELDLGCAESR